MAAKKTEKKTVKKSGEKKTGAKKAQNMLAASVEW
jgi:hypothetical protein